MSVGIIGIKLGMSRIFAADGKSYPVTVIDATNNLVCQVKTTARDGYSAVQLARGTAKAKHLSKQLRGHFEKNKLPLAKSLCEFRISKEQEGQFKIGDKLGLEQFIEGQKVDARGVSKGKGFAGTVKRYNFSMQDATHGNSISHRHLGSTGQCQYPGKVWPGKKMAGQYGNAQSTTQRLEVVGIDEENSLLLIKGAVPGAAGAEVVVKPSIKQSPKELEAVKKKFEERQTQAEKPEGEEAEVPEDSAAAATDASAAKADASEAAKSE